MESSSKLTPEQIEAAMEALAADEKYRALIEDFVRSSADLAISLTECVRNHPHPIKDYESAVAAIRRANHATARAMADAVAVLDWAGELRTPAALLFKWHLVLAGVAHAMGEACRVFEKDEDD